MAREYRYFVGVSTDLLAAVLSHCEQRAPDPDPAERALDGAQMARYRDELARRAAETAQECAA